MHGSSPAPARPTPPSHRPRGPRPGAMRAVRALRAVRAGASAALLAGAIALAGGCQAQRGGQTRAELESAAQDTARRIDEARLLASSAQTAAAAGRDDEAAQKYRRAVEVYPEFAAAWNNLGSLLLKQGDNLGAQAALQRAAELAPLDPRPMANLGVMWQRLNYLDEAQRFYELALDRDPNYLPALREIVMIDSTLSTITTKTQERAKRALLLERDDQWIRELTRRKLLIDQRLAEPDATGRTPGRSRETPAPATNPPSGAPAPMPEGVPEPAAAGQV